MFTPLLRDERGATIIEFAIVAPTLVVLLLGTLDLGYSAYVKAVLMGEVQKAGRDAGLEGGAGSAGLSLDNRVKSRVDTLVSNTTWNITRTRFQSFTKAGQAERFTDTNSNGVRNAGECFDDENGNAAWDSAATSGFSGQGTADDVVIYKAQVTYPRVIPMYGLLGWSPTITVSSSTTLRNQPYTKGATYSNVTICT